MSLCVENLSFAYGNQPVLQNVSFTAESGQLLSILGPNGVGKSTLFRCVLGLLQSYTGRISIDDTDMRGLSARELAKRIAYIPQSHYPSFNYTVYDMVLMGSTNQLSSVGTPGKKQMAEVDAALEKLGIDHLKDRGYGQISGGEQQLVLMARALVQNARTWILDEPVANLDFGNQVKVLTQLKKLAAEGYLLVQSTHNPDQTFLFSDRILALQKGEVIACGAPGEVMSEALMRNLYGIDVEITSLYDDRARVCIPRCVL